MEFRTGSMEAKPIYSENEGLNRFLEAETVPRKIVSQSPVIGRGQTNQFIR